MKISLIAALDRDFAIGRDGTMPWHLPDELAHFKATTMGHALIMGRTTFEAIGRVLPGRRTIVVTVTKINAATSHSMNTCLVTERSTPRTVGRWNRGWSCELLETWPMMTSPALNPFADSAAVCGSGTPCSNIELINCSRRDFSTCLGR